MYVCIYVCLSAYNYTCVPLKGAVCLSVYLCSDRRRKIVLLTFWHRMYCLKFVFWVSFFLIYRTWFSSGYLSIYFFCVFTNTHTHHTKAALQDLYLWNIILFCTQKFGGGCYVEISKFSFKFFPEALFSFYKMFGKQI